MNGDIMKTFFSLYLIFACLTSRADVPDTWALIVQVIDATTGEQVTEARFTAASTPPEFVGYEACLKAAVNIGPIPAHDGVALVLYCRKIEVAEVST